MLISSCSNGQRVLIAVTKDLDVTSTDTGEYLPTYIDKDPTSSNYYLLWKKGDPRPRAYWNAHDLFNGIYKSGWAVPSGFTVYPLIQDAPSIKASSAILQSGARCAIAVCRSYNEYADPSTRFVCYSCRSSGRK